MSFNAVAKAVEAPLSGNLKLVFILMANYADEQDRCYPSQATLARQAGVCEKTIQRVIEKLDEQGFVKTLRKGSGNKSSLYQLIFIVREPQIEGSQNVHLDNLSGSQIVHPAQSNCLGGVVKMSTQGSQIVHRSYQDTINDPINKPIKTREAKFNPETVALPDYVERERWVAYCRMRKAKKGGAAIKTTHTVELCLADLAKFSGGRREVATAVLNQSISKTWTGLFPLHNTVSPTKPNAHSGFAERDYGETIMPDWAEG